MAVCKTLRAFPNGFHFRIQAHRIDNLHSGGRARGRLPRPPCAPSWPTKPHPFANDAQQKGEVRLRTRWPSAKTAVARRSRDTALVRAKASRKPANHHPPPQRRISVLPISALSHFAICVHLCPSVAHRQLPSQKFRAIQPPPRTRQRLGVRWPSTAFPFRPDQLPTDDCPLPTSPPFPHFSFPNFCFWFFATPCPHPAIQSARGQAHSKTLRVIQAPP